MTDREKERLEEVRKYLTLDLKNSTQLQDIVDLAGEICNTPIALITLLDDQTNWLKVRSGVATEAAPKETSFCQFAIHYDDLLVIPDAAQDQRFENNPLVHGEQPVRFYAGAPLTLNNGHKLGTLCVFDHKPNQLSPLQHKTLKILSKQVAFLMELEMSKRKLKEQIASIAAKNETLTRIAYMQSHEIRQPLASIIGLVDLVKGKVHPVDEEWLSMLSESANDLDIKVRAIVNESTCDKDLKTMRFNRMVEEIEDYAVLLLDENGNVENWNKGAQLLKGYSADEIVGKNLRQFYRTEDRVKQLPERMISLATEQGVAKDKGWRVRKDGTLFWASVVLTAIHDDEKRVIGFTKITHDLSENKETRLAG